MQEEFKAPAPQRQRRSKAERERLAAKLKESVGTIIMADGKDEPRPDVVEEAPQIDTNVFSTRI